MAWFHFVSYLFGGCFPCNALPRFWNGVPSRPFQGLFAKPPDQGHSSSIVNVHRGFSNLAIAYLPLCRVGNLSLHSMRHARVPGAGFRVMGLFGARQFAHFHGGNSSEDSSAH